MLDLNNIIECPIGITYVQFKWSNTVTLFVLKCVLCLHLPSNTNKISNAFFNHVVTDHQQHNLINTIELLFVDSKYYQINDINQIVQMEVQSHKRKKELVTVKKSK